MQEILQDYFVCLDKNRLLCGKYCRATLQGIQETPKTELRWTTRAGGQGAPECAAKYTNIRKEPSAGGGLGAWKGGPEGAARPLWPPFPPPGGHPPRVKEKPLLLGKTYHTKSNLSLFPPSLRLLSNLGSARNNRPCGQQGKLAIFRFRSQQHSMRQKPTNLARGKVCHHSNLLAHKGFRHVMLRNT